MSISLKNISDRVAALEKKAGSIAGFPKFSNMSVHTLKHNVVWKPPRNGWCMIHLGSPVQAQIYVNNTMIANVYGIRGEYDDNNDVTIPLTPSDSIKCVGQDTTLRFFPIDLYYKSIALLREVF